MLSVQLVEFLYLVAVTSHCRFEFFSDLDGCTVRLDNGKLQVQACCFLHASFAHVLAAAHVTRTDGGVLRRGKDVRWCSVDKRVELWNILQETSGNHVFKPLKDTGFLNITS